jgi:hypothetical protein
MSKKFVLTDGQSGYEVIGEYIQRYWEEVCYTTVIVSVALADDGDYRRLNIVASPTHDLDIEYLYDWWEGEKEIFLGGIIDVDAVYVNGGIFEPSERSRR